MPRIPDLLRQAVPVDCKERVTWRRVYSWTLGRRGGLVALSVLDNSSRFDKPGLQAAVDFNAMLAAECEALAKIAETVGKKSDRHGWLQRRSALSSRINVCL